MYIYIHIYIQNPPSLKNVDEILIVPAIGWEENAKKYWPSVPIADNTAGAQQFEDFLYA